jgi:hypothetical protein
MYVCPSECLSICPHVSTQFPSDRFPWNLVLGTAKQIFWDAPHLVKIRQKYQAFYLKTWVCFFVAGAINFPEKNFCATHCILILLTVTCSSTVHRECIVAFMLQQWLCEHATMLCYTYICLSYCIKSLCIYICEWRLCTWLKNNCYHERTQFPHILVNE